MNRHLKRGLLFTGIVALGVGGYFVYKIGPSNMIGMALYDQREEGKLQVGHKAPDISLVGLDGVQRTALRSLIGTKPVVLVFGSFT